MLKLVEKHNCGLILARYAGRVTYPGRWAAIVSFDGHSGPSYWGDTPIEALSKFIEAQCPTSSSSSSLSPSSGS